MNARHATLALVCLGVPLLSSCLGIIDVGDGTDRDSGPGGENGDAHPPAGTGGAPISGTGGNRSMAGTGGAPMAGTGGTSLAGTGGTSLAGTGGTSLAGTGGSSLAGTGGRSPAGTGGTPISGTGGASSGSAAGAIVPLYTDPGDPSWSAIVAAKRAYPSVRVVAIVNPSDGPGTVKTSAYANGIAELFAAGIQVIGYVATGYGANSIASVEALIDRWTAFYPQVQGIFFDEQSNDAAAVPHYGQLTAYAKAQGLAYTVGNPGTDTDESYIGVFDTMLIYESSGLPALSSLGGWHSKHAKANFGIIPYAVRMDAQFVRDARSYVEYIYLQNDDLPNPWDSLSSSFPDLLAALQ